MGVSKRTERVLADAANKISTAEETIHEYQLQKQDADERNKQLEEENDQLRNSIVTNALQHANMELRREHMQLKQTLESYQTKIDQMREISLLSAKVVDSRIKTKQGRQYVEYKLQIETDIRGTLVLWHRYSTFLNLASTLKAKNPSSEHVIPELQTQSLTGFFSEQLIADRITKLNEFLEVVTTSDEFQWGIRIDKDTCVYKRKTKKSSFSSGSGSSSSGGMRESIAFGMRESIAFARESISSMVMPRASSLSIGD